MKGFRILAVVPSDHSNIKTVKIIGNSQNEDVVIKHGDTLIGALDRNLIRDV